jgi:ATP-dependent helicase/DNAse subunit B
MIKNYIDNDTILIAPNNIKIKLLEENTTLLNVKCYSIDDIKRKIIFDYDEKTIYYLMNKYGFKYDIARMYLDNIYYVEDKNYNSIKLDKLVSIKKELDDKKLLIYDNLFLKSLKKKKVIVYGYDYIDKYFNYLLTIIKNYANVELITKDIKNNTNLQSYEFVTIDDEINYVAYSICNLIKSGININKIKIANINDEYLIPLKRIFSFYNIPVNMNDKTSLYGTEIVLSFINDYKNTKDFKISLENLKSKYDLNNDINLNIYNKIITICNKYTWVNDEDIIELLISDFKNNYLDNLLLENVVEVINLKNNIIDDDVYVFIMNFNQGSMPIIYQDEDYITDDLKNEIYLETTIEKNKIENLICKSIINKIKNVTITYKLRSKTSEYYKSNLIDELNIPVIKDYKINVSESYSSLQDKINLSMKLDKLVKYNESDLDIDVLYSNYSSIPYQSYDNSFKGINNSSLINYLGNKLKLSYSSIDDYFKCAFKYYINHFMNFKDREEKFYLVIGNLFHYVLSHAFNDSFNFDYEWNNYLKDKELTSKEEYFLIKLSNELKFIISVIKEQNKLSKFDKSLYEEYFRVNFNNTVDVEFNGIIDKIIYREEENTLITIVDYKTGNTDINLNNLIYGINMQLPIYLYLVNNSNKFKNPKFIGFYLQEILHNEISNDSKKEYEDKKRDLLKLKGYTIDEEEYINKFDESYADSRVIKSMKLTKNGFAAYSKILNQNQIDKIIDMVGNKINEGSANILNGKFDINPKRIGKNNVACEFCELKDMCYMKESDIVNLEEYKNMEFLRGDDNA